MSTNNDSPTSSRAMVISGGGARGAWGVGVAKALSIAQGNHYKEVVGTSTGSLMGPLVLTREFDTLEQAYTSVTQKDIFNVNPFTKKGGINFWNLLWRLIRGKKTIGETTRLLGLIPQFFTEETYKAIQDADCEFTATLTSLSSNQTVFRTTNNSSYADMIKWIWASSNQPVFMSLLEKDNQFWADGGLKDYLPIAYAINKGAKKIDVLVHNSPTFTDTDWKPKGSFINTLLRAIEILSVDVAEDNIENARLQVEIAENIEMNLFYMSQDLVDRTKNSLIFDKATMTDILNIGYQSVIDGTVIKKSYLVAPNGEILNRTEVA